MYVDDCQHTFEELARIVLPAHMERLTVALQTPRPASVFAAVGKGCVSIMRELGLSSDFSGCYVLIDRGRPKYVGISRSVIARLRQHMWGKTHFDASLAYSIAQRRTPTKGGRSVAMKRPAFQTEFAKAQADLRKFDVAYVDISNPLELYVFEAYAAVTLGTFEWNTFRTH